MTGGAAAANVIAASSHIPCAKATALATAHITTTAVTVSRPIALRRQTSKPTSSSGSPIAIAVLTMRTGRLRTMPSPATRCVMAVAMISTPGISESNGVGKKSPAPVAVAPSTTMRPSMSFRSTRPSTRSAALTVRMVRRGP